MTRKVQAARFCLAALLTALANPFPSLAAEHDWVLMARHGECHDIDPVLARRFRGLPAIATPEDFVAEMRNRAIPVEVRPMPAPASGDAVIVELPRDGMSLVFARRALCMGGVEPGR